MANIDPILRVSTVTINNGVTVSSSVDMQRHILTGIEFPATLTGTGVTIQVSQDDSNWTTVYQGSADVTITKQNSKLVMLGTTLRSLEGLGRYVRVFSTNTEGATRTLKFYSVPR